MPGADDIKPETPASLDLPKAGVHETPRKALEKVGSEFEFWSGKLTETSLQMCYALIGANWVVFGSVGGILNSRWAKLSLLMVMLTLGINVIGSWVLSEALRRRFEYAEGDSARWTAEFNAAASKRVAWPFTKGIESAGFWLRQMKGLLPIIGGLLLIIGAIRK